MPRATIARLSPTRIISMPAASATWALGKSWAVIMVIGSPLLCIERRVPTVTFFRGLTGGVPIGEWELCRTWCVASKTGRSAASGGWVLRLREAHDLTSLDAMCMFWLQMRQKLNAAVGVGN